MSKHPTAPNRKDFDIPRPNPFTNGHRGYQGAETDRERLVRLSVEEGNFDRANKTFFAALTKFLKMSGGDQPSKIAETATSVQSAKGSTIAKIRNRSQFVIPRKGARNPSTQAIGLNTPTSRGLNIVI